MTASRDPLAAAAPPGLQEVWDALRPLTAARIGLARSGASLSTPALLDFRLAHARARDAVGRALDVEALQTGLTALGQPHLTCHSMAPDRRSYLMRPDLGRQLQPEAVQRLQAARAPGGLAIVVADGLSAQAAGTHALPVLQTLLPLLAAQGWLLAPVVLLHNGRVAAGDAAAAALGAACVLVLLGERPGLSSPDSLGAYMTWAPAPGTSDAGRNCISNIRPQGFAPADAAAKIAWLLGRMRQQQGSGVGLKDDMAARLATG
ncbi:MAG: hypothetical protein JWQ72_179 [Polaromonas sp.]|nr:hypothetical protein [Polaromonas sp.]